MWSGGDDLFGGKKYLTEELEELDKLQNWLHLLILKGGLPVILIDCMVFLSPFLDVTGMCMSTVSLLAQRDSGILCDLKWLKSYR